MTGAEIAATRQLLGLSQAELADMLGVSRDAVKSWESDKRNARPGVVADLSDLLAQHTREVERLTRGAADGIPIELPSGPKPRGWYVALGARVLDRVPDAMLTWA
ncbi:helix-turn-helix transcriptional regulator [Microbacterium rhizophilus]|uniref:helix-turn-helix transcriptional regulator n=1 Tax=Microbacterium rhizophilus TaxID=3138934 RepID=UPI0031E99622